MAASKGIKLDPRVLGSTSRVLKLRIASIRLDPKSHPIADDTRLGLLVKGIRASLREPDISLRVRASQIVWFFLMATAPIAVVPGCLHPSGKAQTHLPCRADPLVAGSGIPGFTR